jgi:hypothetical protein
MTIHSPRRRPGCQVAEEMRVGFELLVGSAPALVSIRIAGLKITLRPLPQLSSAQPNGA